MATGITKSRCHDLIEQGNRAFQQRRSANVDALWQEEALHFYPIRADFTQTLQMGDEFAAHLMTGRPLLAQRDLGNAISAMLRPRGKQWVHARTLDEKVNNDAGARQGLDAISERLLKIFNYQHSQFIRATKSGDADFITFGQCVIEPKVSRDRQYVIFYNYHLRDVVWCEDAELRLKRVDRNWDVEACELNKLFNGNVSPKVTACLKDDPYRKIKCRHIVLPADEYDLSTKAPGYAGKKVNTTRFPFVSIMVDIENDHVMEELPRRRVGYIIPRWLTPSGSQYAHSPATIVALPEARLIQQITLTLLEAGQKAVDPPLKATREAIMGGVNYFAGATTWIDAEYDERTGKALEPVADFGSARFDVGEKREAAIHQLIHEAFFLNKISLPVLDDNKQRTMYEVSKMVEDYIRGALPLFEPIEVEYNAALCEEVFNIGQDHGAFQDVFGELPQILGQRDIVWTFETPLQAAAERAKSEAFVASMNLLKVAAEFDPGTRRDIDISKAFRDAATGSGAPSEWIVKKEEADAARAQDQQMAQMEQAAAAVGGAAQIAGQVGDAGARLKEAGMVQ